MNTVSSRTSVGPFLLASLASGCAALLNQILWSRILSLVFGSTIEAVSAVTAVFMLGLALGSALSPRVARTRDPRAAALLYSRVELTIAASAMALAFLLPALESLRAASGAALAWSVGVVLLLIPSGLMGTTLVLQTRAIAVPDDPAGRSRLAGWLFAANTLGAVAGAYASVLWFLPALGVRRSIFAAAFLNVVAALLGRRFAPSPAIETSTSHADEGSMKKVRKAKVAQPHTCLLYTSPSPRD